MLRKIFQVLLLPCMYAATYTETLSSTTTTSVGCRTVYKTTSATASTLPTLHSKKELAPDFVIISTTTTPVRTVTPKAITTTSTSTTVQTSTVTAATSTDTTSTTTTTTATITTDTTTTITTTETITSTSTVTSTTTSVPSGFISIDNSTGLTNGTHQAKRALNLRHPHADPLLERSKVPENGFRLLARPKYPAAISCVTSLQPIYTLEIIKVHSTVKTTASASTTIITATVTSVLTSTVVPADVTTTITDTETDIVTVTSTDSSTVGSTTSTTVTATAIETSYAQCAASNLLGPSLSNGKYENDIYIINGAVRYFSEVDAYNCCMQCVELAGCEAGTFHKGTCYLLYSGTESNCSTQQYTGFLRQVSSSADTAIAFNGQCGYITTDNLT